LLYKVLFDMKNDLNDLKTMFYKLVESNNLRMPEVNGLRQLPSSYPTMTYPSNEPVFEDAEYANARQPFYQNVENERGTPFIIESGKPSVSGNGFDNSDVEDEPLAMDEIEKEAIRRSLKKYNGRRKEAAEELKISERTLYRKIKQYDL